MLMPMVLWLKKKIPKATFYNLVQNHGIGNARGFDMKKKKK